MFLPREEHVLQVLASEILLWHHKQHVPANPSSGNDDFTAGQRRAGRVVIELKGCLLLIAGGYLLRGLPVGPFLLLNVVEQDLMLIPKEAQLRMLVTYLFINFRLL
jgi:hypothetical protein